MNIKLFLRFTTIQWRRMWKWR